MEEKVVNIPIEKCDINSKKNNSYKTLLKEKEYLKQLVSSGISKFGDGINTIAFSWLVYKITGSTLLIATIFALKGLANLFFGITSGVVSSYYTKKYIIAVCDVCMCVCISLVAVLYITNNLQIYHIYVITFLNAAFESFRVPAAVSLTPILLDKDKINIGVALNSSVYRATELIGLSIAGACIAFVGIGGALLIDALTFLICAIIIFTLKYKEKIEVIGKLTLKTYIYDIKEGFLYIVKDKFILNLCVFGAIINALAVPYDIFQAPYVSEVLNRGSDALVFMSTPLILAMTIGAIFVPKIKTKLGGRNLFILGGVIVGFTYCILNLLGMVSRHLTYPLLSINSFLMGIGLTAINISLQIAMFNRVNDKYLTRVVASFNAILLCSIPITSCIVGIMSKFVLIKTLFLIFGLLTIGLFIVQYFNKYITDLNNC